MIAVIFEVWPAEGRADDYFDIAAALRSDLERSDGFISIERFESITTPGKFLSLSFWRDEESVRGGAMSRSIGARRREAGAAFSRITG